MGSSAASDILIDEEEDEESKPQVNTFQDTIKEMGRLAFVHYPEKTSNLSDENINGLIRAEVINEYMAMNFGYRYVVIDTLIKQKQMRVVSKKGYGLDKIIEFVKSISASFEQTQLPTRLQDLKGRF
jgi:hypothetical protein